MDFSIPVIAYIRCLSVVLSLALLFSLGLHAVQIEHEHFGEAHQHESGHAHGDTSQTFSVETLSSAMHLADKKLILLIQGGVLLLSIAFTLREQVIRLLCSALRIHVRIRERSTYSFRTHNFLHLFLRKGLYHSKAY